LQSPITPNISGFDMSDLFANTPPADIGPRPLADRLRPARLADVIGQDQVLGADAPLGTMLGRPGHCRR